MFSSSNSFLGGGNTARPGQAPFIQQPSPFSQPPPQPQPQPQPGLAPQLTGYPSRLPGYGGPQLQPQPTGIPPGPFTPQFTGYPGAAPPQPSLQPPPTQQPQLQPQFTGYPQQNLSPQPQLPLRTGVQPQPTGKTSSQIADSFQGPAGSQPPPKQGGSSRIPNIRLSFITSQDQAKFEQLFKSAVGDNKTMDGEFFSLLGNPDLDTGFGLLFFSGSVG